MTVTDPDVPDPLDDPRTMQADPGAYGQGEDLAWGADDPAATGEEELATSQDLAGGAGGGDVTDFALGWHWYLDKFDAVVSGRPAPGDWDAFLAEAGPAYGRAPS